MFHQLQLLPILPKFSIIIFHLEAENLFLNNLELVFCIKSGMLFRQSWQKCLKCRHLSIFQMISKNWPLCFRLSIAELVDLYIAELNLTHSYFVPIFRISIGKEFENPKPVLVLSTFKHKISQATSSSSSNRDCIQGFFVRNEFFRQSDLLLVS